MKLPVLSFLMQDWLFVSLAGHTLPHMHDTHIHWQAIHYHTCMTLICMTLITQYHLLFTHHSLIFPNKMGHSCNQRKWIHMYYLKILRCLQTSNMFRLIMICYTKHYTYTIFHYNTFIFFLSEIVFCWSLIIQSPIHLHSIDAHACVGTIFNRRGVAEFWFLPISLNTIYLVSIYLLQQAFPIVKNSNLANSALKIAL